MISGYMLCQLYHYNRNNLYIIINDTLAFSTNKYN